MTMIDQLRKNKPSHLLDLHSLLERLTVGDVVQLTQTLFQLLRKLDGLVLDLFDPRGLDLLLDEGGRQLCQDELGGDLELKTRIDELGKGNVDFDVDADRLAAMVDGLDGLKRQVACE